MSKVLIQDARLAFPNLWRAKAINDGEPRYGCTLLLTPGHPGIALVNEAMKVVALAKWADKWQEVVKSLKAQDKLAIHNGDAKAEYTGFEGNFYISASNKMRTCVVNLDRSPLVESDGKPYGGCYVNAMIELWAQDHKKFGKRINASLLGVQFLRDGDSFGGGSAPAAPEDFPELAQPATAATAGSDEDLF
jgi:hypothetical protein